MTKVGEYIDESSKIIASLSHHTESISEMVENIKKCLKQGGKLLIFGNGGSAAQAQHIAAEFVVRLGKNRRALPAIALTTDTSIITATANDYSFEQIFSRQLEAIACPNDVALALSTSGNSDDVVRAVEKAKKLKLKTIALLGKGGGKLRGKADLELIVDSQSTERIQEAHLLILHIIAQMIENDLPRSGGFLEE